MTHDEYLTIKDRRPIVDAPIDFIELLSSWKDRTLIYGYTVDRDTFHVYIKDMAVVRLIYDHHGVVKEVQSGRIHAPSTMVPNKRVYPETCDFEFCELLIGHGVAVPFTMFTMNRPVQQFYGKIV